MQRRSPKHARSCLGILLSAGVLTGCASQAPAQLIPASDRLLLQQEAAKANPQKPMTVEEMLAKARGKPEKSTPDPITLRVVDQDGSLSIPNNDLQQLTAIAGTQRDAVLIVGPSDDPSPMAAALAANRHARFVAQHLPATLHVTQTRYDVGQPPNTARLDFGDQAIVR
ncbi:MAG: hypothetical protein JWO51_1573 [Rhodospirillales bacterium]|nr:hypothetical protein [Rhodospirillales bacterium]